VLVKRDPVGNGCQASTFDTPRSCSSVFPAFIAVVLDG
jgi:hypothetical protein